MMKRTSEFCVHWRTISSKRLRRALAGAGLLGALWGLGGTTAAGAEPVNSPAPRLLATPVGFNDLVQLLNDPRREIRLEAIGYLETLNRPAGDTVPALIPLFGDPDLGVRVFAVRAAIKAGMPAQHGVPVVAQALVPGYPDVCFLAAQVLGDVGPQAAAALPNLHACLTAPSVWVRLCAAQAALKIDPTDAAPVAVLYSALENEQGEPREFAAHVLSGIVKGMTVRLENPDPEVRRTAVIQLEQLGKTAAGATEAIMARMNDTDLLVRAHAARAAFRAGVPARQIVGTVTGLLDPERLDVLRLATSILAEIGPDARTALPKLHVCLDSPSNVVRLHAGEAALRIDPTDHIALKKMRKALHHKQADVRYFAVNSLGAAVMDSDLATLALHRALSDSDPKVATAAALQLSRSHDLPRRRLPDDAIGAGNDDGPDYHDISPWIAALSHADPKARQAAAICLTIAGPAARAAVPDLMDRLGDSDPVVRLHAALALWEIDGHGYPITPVLVDLLLTNHGGTRIGAIYTLGRMGQAASDVTPWLVQLLGDGKSFDRLLLAEAIVRIEPTNGEALGFLVHNLHHKNPDVRYLATIALGASPLLKKVAIEQALCVAIDDQNARIRSAAVETLSQLQVRHAVARNVKAKLADDVIPASATAIANP